MSDFFTNLALRSVPAAAAVRPRLPSLFEPLGHALGFSVAAAYGARQRQSDMVEESAEPSDTPAMSVRNKTLAVTQAVTRSTQVQAPAPTLAGHTSNAVTRTLRQDDERQRDASTSHSDHAVYTAHTSRTEQSPARASIDASKTTSTESGGRMHAPTMQAAEPPLAANILPRPVSDEPVRSIQQPTSPAASTYFTDAQTAQMIKAVTQPRVAWKDTRHTAPDARGHTPETTIHVTIGRIDVRATPQAPPTATGQRASPVMGLDEYLKQKRGGV